MKYWEREKLILDRLEAEGFVSLTEACALTGGSVATLRRDFEAIQAKGLAQRTHGGLQEPEKVRTRKNYINSTEILDDIDREKQVIARAAAAQVRPGESIFIGAGKTCNMLASLLTEVERLNVLTTSVTAALELAAHSNVRLTLLGGDVHTGRDYIETLDADISHTLRGYYFDKVLLTVEGVDLERGYTVQDKGRTALYTQLARMTRRLYILLDSAKFDLRAFATVYPMDKVCRIISTRNMPQPYVDFYARQGISCTLLNVE
ncbi:MAG: DeoR/GlpR transcriptional regulator [Oscillospiraceae bacterium]|nr:DeoR/GlpR transcriptional regulator [Oscillospiraceae bacterium]